MVLNFLFFIVKIERNKISKEARINETKRELVLNRRAEAHGMEAASYPGFISRV